MSDIPEKAILALLATASDNVATGLAEALELLGPPPQSSNGLDALDKIQRTAVAALLKRVEQQQDILARMYRTALLADGTDISAMTARDIANRMEKLGALSNAVEWSELVRLRNRLTHEYPLSPDEQFDRVQRAIAAAPTLNQMRADLMNFLYKQQLLQKA